ncbi:MAG: hypothetical protein EXS08_00400 [Planctomycetes bacterium]|nr:hypothetical protein [Planctomycetota bacterium]
MLAFTALFTLAQLPRELVQPAVQRSPSGRWSLAVEPHERSGTQGAEYVLRDGDALVWHGSRPFALRRAAVGEDGRVAGVAYSGGSAAQPDPRTLEVVLLAPTGAVRARESQARRSSRIAHTEAVPRARGVFLQPELGRFVVWLEDRQADGNNRFVSSCLGYDLTSGARLSTQRLCSRPEREPHEHLVDVRAIPGTSLALLCWMELDFDTQPIGRDARFQLVDERWRVLWEHSIAHDYQAGDDPNASLRFLAKSSILATAQASFELWFVAEKLRVSFALEHSDDAWKVSELRRAAYVEPVEAEVELGPALRAHLVARVRLVDDEAPPAPPWRARIDSTFARLLLQDEDTLVVRVFDAGGRRLAVCRPAPEQLAAARDLRAAWEPGESLHTGPDGRIYVGHEAGYARFSPSGEPEGVVELASQLAFPPWPARYWLASPAALTCFPGLRIDKRADGTWLRSIQAFTAASDGALAELDCADIRFEGGKHLQAPFLSWYDPGGKPRGGRALPDGLRADVLAYQGGRILSAQGWEALLLETTDGSLRPVAFDVRDAGSRPWLGLAPDGRELWALEPDERSLARYALDE